MPTSRLSTNILFSSPSDTEIYVNVLANAQRKRGASVNKTKHMVKYFVNLRSKFKLDILTKLFGCSV